MPSQLSSLAALIKFTPPLTDILKYKALITQEMLKEDFLAGDSVDVCTEYSESVVEQYAEALNLEFALMMKECEMGRTVDDLLNGSVCHARFQQLN